MAIFNPEPKPTSDPNYGRVSQGTGVNKTYAHLFDGAGDVLTGATVTAKNAFMDSIKTDANKGMDALRAEAGVGEAVDIVQNSPLDITPKAERPADPLAGDLSVAGNPTGKMGAPTAVKRLGSQIEKLSTAAEQNPGQESYYQARVVALTKQLRAQYPGWRDEVDATMEQASGGISANSLRRSLRADAEREAARAASATDKRTQWLTSNEKYLPPNWKTLPFEAVQDHVIAAKGFDHNQEVARNTLALLKSTGEATEEKYRKIGAVALDNAVSKSLYTATTMLGQGGDLISQVREAQAKGLKNTPDDLAKISSQMGKTRAEIELSLENVGSQPLEPGKPATLKSSMKPETWAAIKKQALARVDTLENALKDQNFGVLTAMALDTKAKTNQELNTLVGDKLMRRVMTMKEAGLQDLASNILIQNPKALKHVAQTIIGTELLGTATGEGGSLAKMQQDAQGTVYKGMSTAAVSEVERARIDGHVRLLTDPKTPPDVALKAAQAMFNSDTMGFLHQFKPSEQQKVFQALSSGTTTAAMAKLRSQGDQGLKSWYDYKSYVTLGTKQFLGEVIENANNINSSDNRFNLRMDPQTNRFVAVPTAARGLNFVGQVAADREALVAPINRILDVLEPVLKVEGENVGPKLQSLIQELGYRPGQEPEGFKKIEKALQEAFPKVGGDANGPGGPAAPEPKAPAGTLSFENSTNPLIGLVHKAESGGNYNAFWGAGNSKTDLSKFTLSEVRDLQRERVAAGAESGAVGAFQIIGKTMDKLTKRLGLTGNEQFTPELQDRLAQELFEDAGITKLKQGDISKKEFLNNLSRIWAGIPNASGKSTYAGVGSNRATVSVDEALKAIDEFTSS